MAVGGSTAGCLSSTDASDPTGSPTTTDWDGSDLPYRAQESPVSLEQTITDEPGYGDDLEYFPENETVRAVTASDGTEATGYRNLSVDEWASMKAGWLARDRAASATESRLADDHDRLFSSLLRPPDAYEGTQPFAVGLSMNDETVTLLPPSDRDRSTATSENEQRTTTDTNEWVARLVTTAPRAVDVTISLAEQTRSNSVPVYVTE